MTAYIWFVLLAGIFGMILVYNMFSGMFGGSSGMFNISRTLINDSTIIGSKSTSTIDIMETVWTYWPLPFLLICIFWALIQAQRESQYPY